MKKILLSQSIRLAKLFGEFLAFLAFWPFERPKGQKRPKNKILPNDLELPNLARKPIKNFSQAKIFLTFVALARFSHKGQWPFHCPKLIFIIKDSLY